MNLPSGFKQSMANAFYDKEVAMYSSVETKDVEGWAKTEDIVQTGTFMGNVRFDKLDKIQEDYGIKEKIDVVITTNDDIPLDQIIGYLDWKYRVIRAIRYDSHYLLLAVKWLSKSSISISA